MEKALVVDEGDDELSDDVNNTPAVLEEALVVDEGERR